MVGIPGWQMRFQATKHSQTPMPYNAFSHLDLRIISEDFPRSGEFPSPPVFSNPFQRELPICSELATAQRCFFSIQCFSPPWDNHMYVTDIPRCPCAFPKCAFFGRNGWRMAIEWGNCACPLARAAASASDCGEEGGGWLHSVSNANLATGSTFCAFRKGATGGQVAKRCYRWPGATSGRLQY